MTREREALLRLADDVERHGMIAGRRVDFSLIPVSPMILDEQQAARIREIAEKLYPEGDK